MANTARFDTSTGTDAYVTKTVPASTVHTIQFDVMVPSTTLASVLAVPATTTAEWLTFDPTGFDAEAIFGKHTASWAFETYFSSMDAGTVTPDVFFTVKADITHTSTTHWDVVFSINGTPTITDSGVDFNRDQTQTFQFSVGAAFAHGGSSDVYLIQNVSVLNAASAVVFSSDFSTPAFADWDATAGAATIIAGSSFPAVTDPEGVCVAFGDDALEPTPTWVSIDTAIDRWRVKRGRSYSTDRTETGTAQADFIDTAGSFDPTNSTGPFYPMNPNCPFAIGLQHAVSGAWTTVFTGMVQQVPQTVDVSATLSTGSIMADDLFSLLAIDEIPPGLDFDSSNTGASTSNAIGDTTYASQTVQERIEAVLADVPIDPSMTNIFSGNVQVQASTEPPGTTTLEMIWNAADEFPGVANVFIRKDGVIAFRGRLARFDPTNPLYNINTWNVGDVPAVGADPTMALISKITFDRDVAKIVNAARFTADGITDAAIPGQLSTDAGSITTYGNRTYSGDNLINGGDLAGPNIGDPEASTKEFSDYWVQNFHDAQTRVSQLEFRWVPTTAANATAHWDFLTGVELSDVVNVTTTHPGGGGFSAEPYFVEGITYEAVPSGHAWPDITMTLDLSPAAYFTSNPFS